MYHVLDQKKISEKFSFSHDGISPYEVGIPLVELSDPIIEQIYYFRWHTYCKHLKIDYTLPEAPGGADAPRAGATITLSQGQVVPIRFADGRPLRTIYVGVGWDPVLSGDQMDVDSSVVVGSASSSYDLIYFADREHPTGCVVHHGDNVTGDGDAQDGDDENITVLLDKVPADRDRVVFVLNIYNCDTRHQTLDRVRNLYIRLCDPESKKVLIEYHVSGNTGNDTAMVIGAAIRNGSGWSFKAIGKSLRASDVHAVANRCNSYI